MYMSVGHIALPMEFMKVLLKKNPEVDKIRDIVPCGCVYSYGVGEVDNEEKCIVEFILTDAIQLVTKTCVYIFIEEIERICEHKITLVDLTEGSVMDLAEKFGLLDLLKEEEYDI